MWRGSPSLVVLIGHVVMMVVVLIGVPLLARVLKVMSPGVWLLTVSLLIIQLIAFFIALMKQRSIRYTITNQRVIIERGVLSKSLNEIDMRTIDETELFQKFSERLLGIGSVTLISSDKVFPTTSLRSIKDPRAVRELIRTHAYQLSQRQLFTRAT